MDMDGVISSLNYGVRKHGGIPYAEDGKDVIICHQISVSSIEDLACYIFVCLHTDC
jgi:hypothetical protein